MANENKQAVAKSVLSNLVSRSLECAAMGKTKFSNVYDIFKAGALDTRFEDSTLGGGNSHEVADHKDNNELVAIDVGAVAVNSVLAVERGENGVAFLNSSSEKDQDFSGECLIARDVFIMLNGKTLKLKGIIAENIIVVGYGELVVDGLVSIFSAILEGVTVSCKHLAAGEMSACSATICPSTGYGVEIACNRRQYLNSTILEAGKAPVLGDSTKGNTDIWMAVSTQCNSYSHILKNIATYSQYLVSEQDFKKMMGDIQDELVAKYGAADEGVELASHIMPYIALPEAAMAAKVVEELKGMSFDDLRRGTLSGGALPSVCEMMTAVIDLKDQDPRTKYKDLFDRIADADARVVVAYLVATASHLSKATSAIGTVDVDLNRLTSYAAAVTYLKKVLQNMSNDAFTAITMNGSAIRPSMFATAATFSTVASADQVKEFDRAFAKFDDDCKLIAKVILVAYLNSKKTA